VVPADAAPKIVGLSAALTTGAPRGWCRQDDDRGGRQAGVADEHADVIREAVNAVCAELMEFDAGKSAA